MKFLKFLILSTILLSCSDDKDKSPDAKWTKLGLDGKTVNEIQLSETTLYVATTTGLYRKDTNGAGDFVLLGFGNKNVEAIEVLDNSRILVSLFDKSGAEPPALFQTVDAGETWAEVDSNFGGQTAEPVLDLEVHPDNENILYATGFDVVAKSVNGGGEWQPIYGSWGGLATGVSVVEVNPFAQNEIWAGGQGAIENGFLLRSANESDWDRWDGLVDNPTVVKEIRFSDKAPAGVLVGFEGALLKTTDGGEHWQTLIDSEDNRFYFGICRRPNDAGRIYTGGWLKTSDPQPLILFISDNGGTSWHEHRYPAETYGGILDMQIESTAAGDMLYIGLDKGGVYKVAIGF